MRMRQKPRRVLRRDPMTISQVMGQLLDSTRPGSSTLVICARVGQAACVPPGYRLATCDECGSAVWLNPDLADEHEARGVPILLLCVTCLGE